MKKIYLTIILLFTLLGCVTYPKKTYKLYQKEYSDFTYNPSIDSIEKKYNIPLNSLANIEKIAGILSDEWYMNFDSINQKLSFKERYERGIYADTITKEKDILLSIRIKEIVKKQYDNKTGLILTLGGNGFCGIEGKWYDKLTLKYGFKYCSISCSDVIYSEDDIAKSYNSFAEKYIDSLHGKGWKEKLEMEILEKSNKYN